MIVEDDLEQVSSEDYCSTKRDQFGLTMPVLIDPGHEAPSNFGSMETSIDLLVVKGSRLAHHSQFATEEKIESIVVEALGL